MFFNEIYGLLLDKSLNQRYDLRAILKLKGLLCCMEKNTYHTRQKDELETFLATTRDRQLTMSELVESVNACGVGRSTVYRLVKSMVQEGTLRRFHGPDAKTILYQYVGGNPECQSHFHLKCTRCGTVIHLDCHSADLFRNHILHDHGFAIDVTQCVLYGLCRTCREQEEKA